MEFNWSADKELLEQIQSIPERLFFKIGEVAELVGLKPYVLRYWETEFQFLNPTKSRNGQRVYTRKDVEIVFLIRKLLHKDRFSIEGARAAVQRYGLNINTPLISASTSISAPAPAPASTLTTSVPAETSNEPKTDSLSASDTRIEPADVSSAETHIEPENTANADTYIEAESLSSAETHAEASSAATATIEQQSFEVAMPEMHIAHEPVHEDSVHEEPVHEAPARPVATHQNSAHEDPVHETSAPARVDTPAHAGPASGTAELSVQLLRPALQQLLTKVRATKHSLQNNT